MSNEVKTQEGIVVSKKNPASKRKKKYPAETLYVVAGVAFFSGIVLSWMLISSAKEDTRELVERVSVLENTAILTGQQVGSLLAEVSEDATQRSEQEKAFEEQLALLANNVSSQQTKIETIAAISNASEIIEEWNPYVYRLACFFTVAEDDVREDRGSATLERTADGVRMLTSKHIIERKDSVFEKCELTQSGSDVVIKIPPSSFVKHETKDYAYAYLDADTNIAALPVSQRCTVKPNIGDHVLILGYPGIGSKESVTATEGIISGFDTDNYTTSAKIEKGNSGGAVVDTKRNCFLGLPALVLPGNVESLARILPVIGL